MGISFQAAVSVESRSNQTQTRIYKHIGTHTQVHTQREEERHTDIQTHPKITRRAPEHIHAAKHVHTQTRYTQARSHNHKTQYTNTKDKHDSTCAQTQVCTYTHTHACNMCFRMLRVRPPFLRGICAHLTKTLSTKFQDVWLIGESQLAYVVFIHLYFACRILEDCIALV